MPNTSDYRSKLLRVVSSIEKEAQAKTALKYIELMRKHVNDNMLCDDLSSHLVNKFGRENMYFFLMDTKRFNEDDKRG